MRTSRIGLAGAAILLLFSTLSTSTPADAQRRCPSISPGQHFRADPPAGCLRAGVCIYVNGLRTCGAKSRQHNRCRGPQCQGVG